MLTIVKTHCYSDKENIFKHLMLQLLNTLNDLFLKTIFEAGIIITP